MSSQTTAPSAPFQQWQSFYPSAPAGPYGFGYDQQPVSIQDQIYASVTGNAERTKQQAANDIARDILRAVDANGSTNGHITEINAAQVTAAIERNGSQGMTTTERVNSQLATAVERNGANNMSAIERTSGEARLTTVISDAASRQAQNDSTRDVLRTVDRVGAEAVGSTKDSFATLLGTVERNAGETRLSTAIATGQTDIRLTDVRHSILNDVNRTANEILAASTQSLNVLTKHVTDAAWEQRSALSAGLQNMSEENLKGKFDISQKMGDHYSSLLLENQKLGHFMSAKADGHFAAGQLELQKVKEGLACQASTYNAAAILDAHRNREAIQKDLAEARYEALKSQQYLTDKMSECCCTIKEKIDLVDRDRLRDNLIVSRDDNNVLKVLEFGGLGGGRGYGYGGRRGGSRSRSPGRR
uniref:Uncharacterized protein n=1 Tax=viral metagenome TaxID=1070528 RepID=A0A6C0LCK2_9ZZZZ